MSIKSEIIQILKEQQPSKEVFIEWINSQIKLKIPKSWTYEKIVTKIIDSNNEKIFSKKLYNLNSFEEVIEKTLIANAMRLFLKEDLLLIADVLSNHEKKWKYHKTTIIDIVRDIMYHANKENFSKTILQLILRQEIPPVIQNQKIIVGPLGITRSVVNRSSYESDDLSQILENLITKNVLTDILKNTPFLPENTVIDTSDELALFIFQQLVLSYGTNSDIRKLFNKIIEKGLIRMDQEYYCFLGIITPCGIIYSNDEDPVKKLSVLLKDKISRSELENQLKTEGFEKGPLDYRLYAKCLKNTPEFILNEEYGFSDLRKIGKSLGLIRTNQVANKEELIRYVLLALGFEISKKFEGITHYIKYLENALILINSTESLEKITGIIVNTYTATEKILKDLIYFHIALFWPSVRKEESNEEKDTLCKKIIKNDLKESKDFSRPMFGQLVYLMKKLNEHVFRDKDEIKIIKKSLGRNMIFPPSEIERLIKMIKCRSGFTHNAVEPTIKNPEQIIKEFLIFGKNLKEKQIYPISIKITSDVTNEYGINYCEAVSENNNVWKIKTEEWIEPGTEGLMHSLTDKIAVFPIIVSRFW